jgi:hypothetical protein
MLSSKITRASYAVATLAKFKTRLAIDWRAASKKRQG